LIEAKLAIFLLAIVHLSITFLGRTSQSDKLDNTLFSAVWWTLRPWQIKGWNFLTGLQEFDTVTMAPEACRLGSIATGVSLLLAMFSNLSPVAAIAVSNVSVSSTNATTKIIDVIAPLQPFIDALWPQSSQNSTFIHSPITEVQARNGTVCPYARAQGISSTTSHQNASSTVLKHRTGAISVMVVGDSITQGK
jgi:hypothetical protein